MHPICSDCVVFGDDHKDHRFDKLVTVYNKHREVVRAEAQSLPGRLKELHSYVNEVQQTIEKVHKAKDDKCKELETFIEQVQQNLSNEHKDKI